MVTNLIDTVKGFFTPDVVDRASTRLGESTDGIRKAVDGGVPLVFAGILHRSETGQGTGLLGDARQAATHQLLGSPGTLFTTDGGEMTTSNSWGRNLFGGASTAISNALASFAGIKTSSANTMLNLMTPLSLGVVGNYALDNDLNEWGLSSYLSAQKLPIMSALPTGLSYGSLFGEGAHPHPGIPTVLGHEPQTGSAERPLRYPSYAIWWVLLVIAVLALIAYFLGT